MNTKGYIETDIGDHAHAKWLRDRGWKGEYNRIDVWVQYYVGNVILSLVKYKNSTPVDRWIYLKRELI